MKCPLCTDGTIEDGDLRKVPVKIIMRMYPGPAKVVVGEKIDLSEMLTNLEISSHYEYQRSSASLLFDMGPLPAEVINVMKTDGSTIYELTVDLSGLKEI